jgi:hypothetical protein
MAVAGPPARPRAIATARPRSVTPQAGPLAQLRRRGDEKLIEAGMSQRQAAKTLGVDESTLRYHLRNSRAESAQVLRTGSAATKAHRALVASGAAAEPTPAEDAPRR